MSGEYVDLIIRRQSLAEQAQSIAVETAAIDRGLHHLLAGYLAQHVPQCSGEAHSRWAITAVDERGVTFICESFFYGFDAPGRPREVLMPMSWIWSQPGGAYLLPADDAGSAAHIPVTHLTDDRQPPAAELEAAS